jgi:hypothetical protein
MTACPCHMHLYPNPHAWVLAHHCALRGASLITPPSLTGQYLTAQLIGTLAAVATSFLLTPSVSPSPLAALTSCSQPWGPALLVMTLFSSLWTYLSVAAIDTLDVTLETSCT